MSVVQGNLIARERLTRRLLADLSERDEVISHTYTLNDCQKAAERVREAFDHYAVMTSLQRFAVERVKDLPVSMYPAYISFCIQCVGLGVPPWASWSGDQPTYPEQWL